MSFGMFESAVADDKESEQRKKLAQTRLAQAAAEVDEKMGTYLAQSTSSDDYSSRVQLAEKDIRSIIARYLEGEAGFVAVVAKLKPHYLKKTADRLDKLKKTNPQEYSDFMETVSPGTIHFEDFDTMYDRWKSQPPAAGDPVKDMVKDFVSWSGGPDSYDRYSIQEYAMERGLSESEAKALEGGVVEFERTSSNKRKTAGEYLDPSDPNDMGFQMFLSEYADSHNIDMDDENYARIWEDVKGAVDYDELMSDLDTWISQGQLRSGVGSRMGWDLEDFHGLGSGARFSSRRKNSSRKGGRLVKKARRPVRFVHEPGTQGSGFSSPLAVFPDSWQDEGKYGPDDGGQYQILGPSWQGEDNPGDVYPGSIIDSWEETEDLDWARKTFPNIFDNDDYEIVRKNSSKRGARLASGPDVYTHPDVGELHVTFNDNDGTAVVTSPEVGEIGVLRVMPDDSPEDIEEQINILVDEVKTASKKTADGLDPFEHQTSPFGKHHDDDTIQEYNDWFGEQTDTVFDHFVTDQIQRGGIGGNPEGAFEDFLDRNYPDIDQGVYETVYDHVMDRYSSKKTASKKTAENIRLAYDWGDKDYHGDPWPEDFDDEDKESDWLDFANEHPANLYDVGDTLEDVDFLRAPFGTSVTVPIDDFDGEGNPGQFDLVKDKGGSWRNPDFKADLHWSEIGQAPVSNIPETRRRRASRGLARRRAGKGTFEEIFQEAGDFIDQKNIDPDAPDFLEQMRKTLQEFKGQHGDRFDSSLYQAIGDAFASPTFEARRRRASRKKVAKERFPGAGEQFERAGWQSTDPERGEWISPSGYSMFDGSEGSVFYFDDTDAVSNHYVLEDDEFGDDLPQRLTDDEDYQRQFWSSNRRRAARRRQARDFQPWDRVQIRGPEDGEAYTVDEDTQVYDTYDDDGEEMVEMFYRDQLTEFPKDMVEYDYRVPRPPGQYRGESGMPQFARRNDRRSLPSRATRHRRSR